MRLFKKKEKEEPVRELKAYISGDVMPVTEVQDEVFSSKALGDGIAIRPAGELVTAPCDGVVSAVADTGHAVGFTANNGAELLIHVGLDTVSLNGEGFCVLVKQGDRVKQGTPLLKFDRKLIEERGLCADCILIVTNTGNFPNMKFAEKADAVQNDTIVGVF